MAIIDNIPTLYRLLVLLCESIYASIMLDKIIPSVTDIKDIIISKILEKWEDKYFNDSGIKSRIETQIITADANEHVAAIKLLVFLIFTKIGIVPKRVAKPANIVRINGYI